MGTVSFMYNIDLVAAVCFITGFILVVVEMFHPGFGIPGIAGTVLLLLGVVITAKSVLDVLIMLIIVFTILGCALTVVLKSVTTGRLSKSLVLHSTQKKEAGYIGTEDLNYFLGQEGTSITILRPSGTGDFNGIKLDVVSQGEFISKDKAIKIVKVEGRRIVVEEV
jgi:membrane-bound ClpP family serine protease